jgi:hypothetical protein
MKYVCLALALVAIGVSAQKPRKAPDVEVVDVKCHRTEDKLTLDGKVKVTGEKPLKGLVLEFSFLGSSGDVLTAQKAEVSDETLNKNEEPSFHAETLNPPGSIQYKIRAFDAAERELRIGNAGPFTIE